MRCRSTRSVGARSPLRRGVSWASFLLVRFFLAAWLVALIPGSAKAAELINGPTVEFTEDTRAVVRWKTDVSTGSRVFFGDAPDRLTRRGDGSQGTEHEVTLPLLAAGTTWYYSVGTARVPLGTNSFVVPGRVSGDRARSDKSKESSPPS